MKIIIEEDLYGNIVKRITSDQSFFQIEEYGYNDKGDLISEIVLDQNNVIIHKFIHENQYDESGNIIYKKSIYLNNEVTQADYSSFSELFYDNYYDDDGNLNKVICRYDTKNIQYIIKYYYEDDNLIRKEFYKEKPFDLYQNISYFIYDHQGKIAEEKICLKAGEISHYIEYTSIADNRYKKKIVNPERSNYRWILDDINHISCSISLYEPLLTGELMGEILDYIRNNYTHITDILISLNYAEDASKLREIIETEDYYREKYNLIVTRSH